MLALVQAAALALNAGPRLEIAVNPFVDLHFHVRALAAGPPAVPACTPGPDLPALRDAVQAARELDRALGGALAWGPIEGPFGGCSRASEALAIAASLPETFEPAPGRKVELRKAAVALAQALAKAEPVFLEEVWPAHRAAIEAARERIDEVFAPRAGECLAHIAGHLGLALDARAIPVRIVARMPEPGAVTHRDGKGGAVCFVAIRGVEGTRLYESILHEAIHALDVATKEGSVLADLRARLVGAGFSRRDRIWRDVPHTLMFVQASETIRRLVDPRHEAYGVAAGYYDKVRAVADLEIPVWTEHLDGKTTREEAVAAIVAGAVAAGKGGR